MKNIISLTFTTLLFSPLSYAKESEQQDVQDMSDPLAVYTQAGIGATNKGINIKLGQAYDTGNEQTVAMHLLEAKGALGDSLGWDEGAGIDNAIDSLRYRHFGVNLTNGRGSQIEFNYNLDESNLAERSGDISYSIIQALPKMGPVNLYPLAGLGGAFGNNAIEDDGTVDSGFSAFGVYGLVGLYGKLAITDKIWLNYNPFYLSSIAGSSYYQDNTYGAGNSSIFLHEFVLSYQINPKLNIRYFANWNEYVDFNDGDHRLEINYQL